MLYNGFKFGMLLQFAIGPVCLFIFQIAALKGFYTAFTGVLGVSIIDGLYILSAILGIAYIIERKSTKIALKIFGAIVLLIFGASNVLSLFNISLLPSLGLDNVSYSGNAFLSAVILTASNPLSIIFWAGVFSAKLAEEGMKRRDFYSFGFGALLSTVFFLTIIFIRGSLTGTFLPSYIIQILNLVVGFLLIYFSIRMFLSIMSEW